MAKSKSDLINHIAEKAGITKAQAGLAVDGLKSFITENARDGIQLIGIGSFKFGRKAARNAKLPNGETKLLAAKNTLSFKVSKEISEAIQD